MVNCRERVERYLENTEKATVDELSSNIDNAKETIRKALRRLQNRDKVVRVRSSDNSTVYYKIKDSHKRILDELGDLRREILQLRTEVRS